MIFQKEDGSPGGVGEYLLNKLRLALPGETLEPVSKLYTVLIPPCFLAHNAADDWVGFPKGCRTGLGSAGGLAMRWMGTSRGASVVLLYGLADPLALASTQGYACGSKDACPGVQGGMPLPRCHHRELS